MNQATPIDTPADKSRRLWILSACVLAILDRCRALFEFGLRYTDDDQTLMWYAAREFSRGRFHEPRFFGQAYNSMLEALLAAPLVRCGLAPSRALPVTAALMALLPFFLLGILAYRKGHVRTGAVIVALPALLPLEYSLLTSMARGWNTGFFLAGLSLFFGLKGKSKLDWFFCGFLLALAVSLHFVIALVVLPVGLFFLLKTRQDTREWVPALCGIAAVSILHALSEFFYLLHPEHELHAYPSSGFSFLILGRALLKIDDYLGAETPVLLGAGWFFLLLLVAFSILFLARGHRSAALVAGIAFAVVLLSLGLSTVHSGSDSIYFHRSRIYVGVPVLFAFFLSIPAGGWPEWVPPRRKGVIGSIFVLSLVLCVGIKQFRFEERLEEIVARPTYGVKGYEVRPLEKMAGRLDALARGLGVNLVIFSDEERGLAYAFEALAAGPTRSFIAGYERRIWAVRYAMEQACTRLLIYGFTKEEMDRMKANCRAVKAVDEVPSLFLIKGPVRPVGRFLLESGLPVRRL